MVSGYMDEVGAAQLTVTAKDKEEAKRIAIERYGFDQIVNVTEIVNK